MVVARVIPPTLALMHRKFGVYVTVDQIQDYPHAFEGLGLKKEFFECLHEVHKSSSLEFLDKWTLPTLMALHRKHEVYILTGNPPSQIHLMLDFLTAHGVYNMDVTSSFGHMKNEYEWDILIEDDPRAADFINKNRDVIMLTQEWNKRVRKSGLMRANTWKQVGMYVDALELTPRMVV